MIRKIAAAAVVVAGLLAVPGSAHAAGYPNGQPAEPAICGPVVALIEYWLPIADKATPHPRIVKRYPSGAVTYAQPGYPWSGASATMYGISRYATGNLRVSTVTAADAIHALGAGPDPSAWRHVLRAALAGIRSACPSLPRSVVNGPLPR